jgi:hypothetical protein
MARRRLLAIFGALGLGFGLISSGIVAQAETEPPTLDALIWTWSSSTQNVCISNGVAVLAPGGFCSITQGVSAEDNVAICVQNNIPGGGTCDINQTNSTEDNRAIVLQRNSQWSGASQSVTHDVTINQLNDSGRNDAWVGQIANQSTTSAGKQVQTVQQFDAIDQNATAGGGQKVLLGQLSAQRASSSSAEQDQFSNQDVSESGGLSHHINQDSTGLSVIAVGQAQIQTATSSGLQNQVVDPRCCSHQLGNTNDVFKIVQFVFQKNNASPADDPQSATSVAECHTLGNCTTFQSTTNNTTTSTNNCSGQNCVAVVQCGTPVEGGGCSHTSVQCTGESCIVPPPAVCPQVNCPVTLLNSGAWAMAAGGRSMALNAARSAPTAALRT